MNKLTEFVKAKKELVILAVIILAQLVNIMYWGKNKEGLFLDELYTYEFVCQTDYPSIHKDRPDGTYLNSWHETEYYQDYLVSTGEEKFDLAGTYRSIEEDVHPPFYYLLMKIACSVFGGLFTKWSGIFLNIFFWIITQIFVYLLLRRMTDSTLVRLFGVALYGFSVGSVSTVTFIRMYMVLACFSVMFCYLHAVFWTDEDALLNPKRKYKMYVALILLTILGFLTQFFFLLVAFPVCAIYWIYLLCRKRFKTAIEYLIAMALGLGMSVACWPYMFKQVFGAVDGYSSHYYASKTKEYLLGFLGYINSELFAKAGIAVVALCVIGAVAATIVLKRRKYVFDTGKIGIAVSLSVMLVFDIITVAIFSAWNGARYIYNIYPIILLLVVLAVELIIKTFGKGESVSRALTVIAALALCFMCAAGYKTTGVSNLYPGTKSNIKWLKQYEGCPLIFVVNTKYARAASAQDVIYFRCFDKVYPINIDKLETVPDALEEIGYHGDFLMLVDESLGGTNDIVDQCVELVGAKGSSTMFTTQRSSFFLIEFNQAENE